MIKKFIAKKILLALNFFLLCTPLIALADDATDLSNRLKRYNTLSGHFEQNLIADNGELIQDSAGTFTLKRPGYFYWDTQEPFPQLLIADLQTIWLYDPDLEQVTIRPYADNIDQSPALLLSGDSKKITEYYSVTRADAKKDEDIFRLKPRGEDSTFVALQLRFTNQRLTSMQLTDTLQQTTTLQFSNLTLNQPIDNSLFTFTPPAGVDVLFDD